MPVICYYSNFCEPSKKLLQVMARSQVQTDVHFICIDQRSRNAAGQTVLEVQGQQVLLPPTVTRVPALYFMETQQTLFEDAIYKHLAPKEATLNHTATNGLGEPECFSNQFLSMSDSYSFWDQDANDLGTKGDGGMRQKHSYVSVNDSFSINTPKEDYEPDKVGKKGSKTLEEYKAERAMMVPDPIART
jgi:hypothetical protein